MARYTPPGSLNSILAINAELEKISEAFENTVSRKNDSPNQMEGDLDLNGNSLLNLKSDPNNPDSILLKKDVYTKEETDELLEENREYTDEREANIRADFSEGITGATVVVYPDIASLEASEPTQTGQRAEVVETGGQYITADVSYTPIAGDYTAGNGRIWQLVGGYVKVDLVVNIPSDHPTMQDAIDYYHNKVLFTDGNGLAINIESGHQPSTGISVSNGDYSYIRITSDDAEVLLNSSFSGGAESSVIYSENAKGPILSCLININGVNVFNAYNATACSSAFVDAGCGMKNGNRGMHVHNGSVCFMDSAIFTGFQQAGLHVSRAGKAQCSFATLSGNSQDPANTFGGVYASRASFIHGADIDASGSGGDGVRAQRGAVISVPGVDVSNATKIALVAVSKAEIYSGSAPPVMSNLAGQAIVAQQGAKISIDGTPITFQAGMSSIAVECRSSTIIMSSSSLSGHEGIGIFAKGAGGNVEAAFTSITGGTMAIQCEELAQVNAANSTLQNGSGNGAFAAEGGKICITNGEASGFSNDLAVVTGSWISANGCTTTNGAGSPDVSDTNLTGGFNFANNGTRGFIWA